MTARRFFFFSVAFMPLGSHLMQVRELKQINRQTDRKTRQEPEMNFTEQYLSPCVHEQVGRMTVGMKVPLLPILEKAIRSSYVDGYNSGKRKAMWRTMWHTMGTDPRRVVRPEDRNGFSISVLLYDGSDSHMGTYDTRSGRFSMDAVAWKLADRPDMASLAEMEDLWQENTEY